MNTLNKFRIHYMSNNKIEIAIALLKLDENYLCLERNKSPFLHTIEFPGGKNQMNQYLIVYYVKLKKNLIYCVQSINTLVQ